MPTHIQDYTVGWICAIDTEYVAACEFLDEEYKIGDCPRVSRDDLNIYTFGRIYQHNVVIACLPDGRYGLTSAAVVATRMRSSFPTLRFGLMVGIAGGAPSHINDIRLGDIVVSSLTPRHGGVIQYDFGKAIQDHEFEETGHLGPPPEILLNALSKMRAQHRRRGHNIPETIIEWLKNNERLRLEYGKPDVKLDRLYKSSYTHLSNGACACQNDNQNTTETKQKLILEERIERDSKDSLHIHFGLVASANKLMKDATARDAIARKHNVLCFEMEAAGLMNNFPCLVIRGICDYSDTHKNNRWQGYAAAVAAAYAKELLGIIPGMDTKSTEDNNLIEAIRQADLAIREYYISTGRLKIERLSGEPLPLEKCYINLAMRHLFDGKQPKDGRPSFSLSARLYLEANENDEQVSLSELFKLKESSDRSNAKTQRIFIQGRAGIGKTTLCKKIVYEFLQGRLENEHFERLLWIPLRSLQERDAKYEWLELLQDVFALSSQVSDWDDLAMTMSKQLSCPGFRQKTLFLLDGLDEASRGWEENSKIFRFLQSIISTLPNIILTSRPQTNSLKVGNFDLELDVIGFSLDQVNTYIDHCVADKQTNSSMKNTIATKPFLQGLLRIPVQLDAFCCTWSSNIADEKQQPFPTASQELQVERTGIPSTMTTLYQEITNELCRKDLARTRNFGRTQRLHTTDILYSLEEELNFLEGLAFQGLVSNIIVFNHQYRELFELDLRTSGLKLPEISVLEQLSFLRTSSDQLHYSRRDYHFLHLTYQEFFAARHFVRHWRTGTDLYYLKLSVSGISSKENISPSKFIQTEKYNPRYNIFWRFVTGLIQLETSHQIPGHGLLTNSADSKNIVFFFKQLNDEPLDLFGAIHRQLMMYCLSEVALSDAQDIQVLRQKEENLLRQWTIAEYDRKIDFQLANNVEFPESVLLSFIQSEPYLRHEKVLGAFRDRLTINKNTLDVVNHLMGNASSNEVQLLAADIIWKNSAATSQEMLSAANDAYMRQIKHPDMKIRYGVGRHLAYMNFLPFPHGVLPVLVESLKDSIMQYFAVRALEKQSSLPQELVAVIIGLLNDKDEAVRRHASKALQNQNSLPHEFITVLVDLLKDRNSNGAHHSARLLAQQSFLPHDITTALLEILYDKDTRNHAVLALKNAISLPEEAIVVVIALLDDNDVRYEAARLLAKQLFLSQEAIIALIVLLKNKSAGYYARIALEQQRSLPQEAITTIVAMLLGGEDIDNQAARVLSNQSNIPQEIVTAFVIALDNHDNHIVRSSVAKVLGNVSPLPQEAIIALINVLLKDKDKDVRLYAATSLRKTSSPLSQEAINALATVVIKDEDLHVRAASAQALKKMSSLLPQEAMIAFATALNDDEAYVQLTAAEALADLPFLPQQVVTALITACLNHGRDFQVLLCVREALEKASFTLSQESITAFTAMLRTGPRWFIYLALHRSNFYPYIKGFDNSTWQGLWDYWTKESYDFEFCCYQYEGALYLRYEGGVYQICADPKRTRELLRIVSGTIRSQLTIQSLSKLSWRSKLKSKLLPKKALPSSSK